MNNESEELDALSMCGNAARQRGERERSGPALGDVDEADVEQPRGGLVANKDGLNLYASGVIDGNDRERLEHLCRYLLRGPLALGRLKLREDGKLTYRMKKADRRGNTVMVLTPRQLLARLCSLIPAPGVPTRKYFGVLCGAAKERKHIVPQPTARKGKHCGDDEKPPVQSPVKWHELLRRVWGLDALACHVPPRDGVVALSERAGSFEELEPWVLPVDPLDVEQTAAQLEAALELPQPERGERAHALRTFVEEHDVARWIALQLHDLEQLAEARA